MQVSVIARNIVSVSGGPCLIGHMRRLGANSSKKRPIALAGCESDGSQHEQVADIRASIGRRISKQPMRARQSGVNLPAWSVMPANVKRVVDAEECETVIG